MHRKPVEPEIIAPERGRDSVRRSLEDETLARLAWLLDDLFQIPGTNIRIGLDALIGLIPGLGDLLSGTASFLIVFAA